MSKAKNIHFMGSENSHPSASAQQEASHLDELFMQQRMFFSDSLKELKDLRKQLYSAAEHFEVSYSNEDENHIVVESLKDYVIKAFVSTVDHLGSLAYKVNGILDEKIFELPRTELRFSCIEQRLRTCQYFTDRGGLFQQTVALKFPKHHKSYIFPAGTIKDAVGHTQPIYHSNAKEDFCQFGSGKAVHATASEVSPTIVRKGHPALRSAQSSSRPEIFQFTKVASCREPEKQSVSLYRFPFIRSGSLARRSIAMNHATDKKQYPSVPQRSVSLSIRAERDGTKDIIQHSGKSRRLFKALLSMHKSKREGTWYK